MIRKLLVAGVAVVVLAGAGAGFVAFRPGSGEREVVIPRGATTGEIGRILEREGVIGSDAFFELGARLRRLDGKIQAGRYELKQGMGILSALGALAVGPAEKGTGVTVPEGFSVRQVSERVGRTTKIPLNAFVTAATNGSIRGHIQPPNVNTLEGFLFPETYFVSENEDAGSLLRRMAQEFQRRTDGLDWSYPESKGLSRYEVLIAASLVEREAKVAEDRSKVAAVIYNRLAKGMRLQIDITALYGLDEHKVPTRADLQRRSPYNTYLIDGLPPTPIANPGLPAIEAVLRPAPIDAIYYVVIDPSGRHGFTSDPQEFERLKQQRPDEVH
ncbi:MAG: endolytic transglycosylase MltG [Actinomycetota bacterium]